MVDDATDETVQQTVQGVTPNRARTDPAAAQTIAAGSDGGDVADRSDAPTVAARPRNASTAPADVGSRYRLGELLGEGGMGEVVLAFDEQIGREVAIKRIRSSQATPEATSRFMREARVQGRLEHPAVVPVHDLAIDSSGCPFFVMKRLTGTLMSDLIRGLHEGSAADVIATRARLLRAFADVCLAIEFAHAKGIVHRDLKPSNVMLGDFGEVYVLDWGIARAEADADDSAPTMPKADLGLESGETQVGTVLGTPAYMAPEQLVGERATAAADIYALGCILFEIVAGTPLHKQRSQLSALASIDARPSAVRPDAPPELDVVCVHATKLDPTERPPSARALGDAVQAYLDGDRDLAMRKQLARHHIAEATAALARGTSETDRRDAMRAAGRALALDPSATEAVDIVSRLVLEPPAIAPAEVDEVLERIDTETARHQGRLSALAVLGYLGFIPLIVWSGLHDRTWLAVFVALVAGCAAHTWALTRRQHLTSGVIYVNAAINALLIGTVCRLVGPFIIAPTLVLTTMMAYAAHPRIGRVGPLSVILAASIAVPWCLELVGVFPSTYSFAHGALVLRSSVIDLSAGPVQLANALLLVSLLAVISLLSRLMAERQRDASKRAELQAWHLRQLVVPGS